MKVNRFEVHLVNLDPTVGAEVKKTRPCCIISPDEMNHHISTVIVAPMTTKVRDYPTRIVCEFQNKFGHIVLDQIRTIDKSRLVKRMGKLSSTEQDNLITALQPMFAK